MSILGNNLMVNESGSAANIENYKIVIVGDQHVGKTSILSRFKYEAMEDSYAPTVGIDFLTKNVFLEDKTIRLIMWDTAGQERFKALIPSYLKNADSIILTYDITNKQSFLSLNKWLKDVKENTKENTFIIMCGNKLDLNSKRTVNLKDVENFSNENNLPYIEVSALSGKGIEDLFNTISRSFFNLPISKVDNKKEEDDEDVRSNEFILQKNNKSSENQTSQNNSNKNLNVKKTKKKKCC